MSVPQVVLRAAQAGDPDWLAARRAGVTASEIAIVMGLAPVSWDSAYSLWHRKSGDLPETPDEDEAMSLGRFLEEYVAVRFAERYPEFLIRGDGLTLYHHKDRPWQMATPDRLVWDHADIMPTRRGDVILGDPEPLAVLECKTSASFEGWGDDGTDEIPVHYRCQALWQADVMDVQAVFVACLFLHNRTIRVYELTLDAQALMDLNIMRAEAAAFLDCLARGVAPAVDWRPETGKAIRRLHPLLEDTDALAGKRLAISYRAAVRHAKEADQRKAEMTNKLLAAMGNARRVLVADGHERDPFKQDVLAIRSVSEPKRIDTKRLRKDFPNIAKQVEKESKPEIRLLPRGE